MKKGRPPKQPTGTQTTLTLKIPTPLQPTSIHNAHADDLTLTEYLTTLIQRDTGNHA